MTDLQQDDLLDRVLRSARGSGVPSEAVEHALRELVLTLENESVRTDASSALLSVRLGRRARWGIGAFAVLTVLGLPLGAVAAGSWFANTGEYGDPSVSTEVADRSQWLGLDAPDAPAAVLALYDQSLPLPAGATSADAIRPIAAMLATMGVVPDGETGHVLIQEETVKGLFERAARCLWYREWLEADAVADSSRRDAATEGIEQSRTWPITVALHGGGVVKMSQGAPAAARSGDRATVLAAYGECSNFYGPVSE